MEKLSFCKNSKKKNNFFLGGVGGRVRGGVGLGGVRVDGNGEVKLVPKFQKKIWGGGGGRVGGGVSVLM